VVTNPKILPDHEPEITLEPDSIKPGKITIVYDFEFGSIIPKRNQDHFIPEILEILNSNPSASVKIIGHTDNIGSEEFNQRLSVKRAMVFYDTLMEYGIGKTRISIWEKVSASR